MNLVEVDKVLEFVNKEFQYCSGYPNCGEGDYMYECAVTDARNKIKAFLKAQPTVEAAPVVHGKWVESGKLTKCSICNNPAVYTLSGRLDKTTYCGLCGAKMDL